MEMTQFCQWYRKYKKDEHYSNGYLVIARERSLDCDDPLNINVYVCADTSNLFKHLCSMKDKTVVFPPRLRNDTDILYMRSVLSWDVHPDVEKRKLSNFISFDVRTMQMKCTSRYNPRAYANYVDGGVDTAAAHTYTRLINLSGYLLKNSVSDNVINGGSIGLFMMETNNMYMGSICTGYLRLKSLPAVCN